MTAQRHVTGITLSGDYLDWAQGRADTGFPLGRTALAICLGQAGANQFDQFERRQRFCPEDDLQPFVLGTGVGQAAEDDDGDPIISGTDLPDQFRPATAGHQMISDDHCYAITKGVQGSQCTFGGGSDGHVEAGPPQHLFADTQLHRVVINEEDAHYPKVLSRTLLAANLFLRT